MMPTTSAKSVDQLKQTFVDEMLKSFDQADKDGDGNIDFMEFIREQWEGRPGENFTNILHAAFTFADPKSKKKTVKSSVEKILTDLLCCCTSAYLHVMMCAQV